MAKIIDLFKKTKNTEDTLDLFNILTDRIENFCCPVCGGKGFLVDNKVCNVRCSYPNGDYFCPMVFAHCKSCFFILSFNKKKVQRELKKETKK